MPQFDETCKGSVVEIARSTQGTPTAKLLAVLIAAGVTDNRELAQITGLSLRSIQHARATHCVSDATHCAQPIAPRNPLRSETQPIAHDAQSIALARDLQRAQANTELPSEVSFNRQTDSREHEVGQSVEAPSAELKLAFNGSTENLISDIQGWMGADRQHAVKWLTTLLSLAGSDAVLAAYGQLLESKSKGKLIADPIRYLGKTAPTLKGKQPAAAPSSLMIDGKPFKVSSVRFAKPREEVARA